MVPGLANPGKIPAPPSGLRKLAFVVPRWPPIPHHDDEKNLIQPHRREIPRTTSCSASAPIFYQMGSHPATRNRTDSPDGLRYGSPTARYAVRGCTLANPLSPEWRACQQAGPNNSFREASCSPGLRVHHATFPSAKHGTPVIERLGTGGGTLFWTSSQVPLVRPASRRSIFLLHQEPCGHPASDLVRSMSPNR